MTDALKQLLKAAKKAEPTAQQREEQRRSFAYGNTAFENNLITREMVDRQAEQLAREADGSSAKRKACQSGARAGADFGSAKERAGAKLETDFRSTTLASKQLKPRSTAVKGRSGLMTSTKLPRYLKLCTLTSTCHVRNEPLVRRPRSGGLLVLRIIGRPGCSFVVDRPAPRGTGVSA